MALTVHALTDTFSKGANHDNCSPCHGVWNAPNGARNEVAPRRSLDWTGAAGARGPRPSGRGSGIVTSVEERRPVALLLRFTLEGGAVGVVGDAVEVDGLGAERIDERAEDPRVRAASAYAERTRTSGPFG